MTALLVRFGGAGVILLWERLLRPMHNRKNITERFSCRASINLRLLGTTQGLATFEKIPPDMRFSNKVFGGVVEDY